LLIEFIERIVKPNYPEGIGATILALMEKVLAEQEEKERAPKAGRS